MFGFILKGSSDILNSHFVVWGLVWNPITSEKATRVERPFKVEEVYRAIFECNKDKSPDSDGFSMAFFQQGWTPTKEDLMNVLTTFIGLELLII